MIDRAHSSFYVKPAYLSRYDSRPGGRPGRTPTGRRTARRPGPSPSRSPVVRGSKTWLAGGSIAMLAVLAVFPGNLKSSLKGARQIATAVSPCETVVQSAAHLSRDQLSRFLAIPAGSSKGAVQRVMQSPYCILKAQPVSSAAIQEAYPLAFDPQTWIVVSYQDETYTGYDFRFRP